MDLLTTTSRQQPYKYYPIISDHFNRNTQMLMDSASCSTSQQQHSLLMFHLSQKLDLSMLMQVLSSRSSLICKHSYLMLSSHTCWTISSCLVETWSLILLNNNWASTTSESTINLPTMLTSVLSMSQLARIEFNGESSSSTSSTMPQPSKLLEQNSISIGKIKHSKPD